MAKKAKKALEGSIQKWIRIISEGGEDGGPDNCPLCQVYNNDKNCTGCPVKNFTRQDFCLETPYEEWDAHMYNAHYKTEVIKIRCEKCEELAKKELAFLQSLKEKDEKGEE